MLSIKSQNITNWPGFERFKIVLGESRQERERTPLICVVCKEVTWHSYKGMKLGTAVDSILTVRHDVYECETCHNERIWG